MCLLKGVYLQIIGGGSSSRQRCGVQPLIISVLLLLSPWQPSLVCSPRPAPWHHIPPAGMVTCTSGRPHVPGLSWPRLLLLLLLLKLLASGVQETWGHSGTENSHTSIVNTFCWSIHSLLWKGSICCSKDLDLAHEEVCVGSRCVSTDIVERLVRAFGCSWTYHLQRVPAFQPSLGGQQPSLGPSFRGCHLLGLLVLVSDPGLNLHSTASVVKHFFRIVWTILFSRCCKHILHKQKGEEWSAPCALQ